MEEKLRAHIDELFKGTALTRRTAELKEEMAQNLTEKFNDLLGDGKSPEAAYSIAVAGIGDIDALLKTLEYGEQDGEFMQAQRQRSAVYTAIAVMLYILSVLPLIITQILVPNVITLTISLSILFAVVAAATGILVYNSMTKVREAVRDDSPEAKSARRRDRNRMHGAVSSTLWILILILYFIGSFATSAWHLTWLIFLVGAAIESILSIFIARKNDE